MVIILIIIILILPSESKKLRLIVLVVGEDCLIVSVGNVCSILSSIDSKNCPFNGEDDPPVPYKN